MNLESKYAETARSRAIANLITILVKMSSTSKKRLSIGRSISLLKYRIRYKIPTAKSIAVNLLLIVLTLFLMSCRPESISSWRTLQLSVSGKRSYSLSTFSLNYCCSNRALPNKNGTMQTVFMYYKASDQQAYSQKKHAVPKSRTIVVVPQLSQIRCSLNTQSQCLKTKIEKLMHKQERILISKGFFLFRRTTITATRIEHTSTIESITRNQRTKAS